MVSSALPEGGGLAVRRAAQHRDHVPPHHRKAKAPGPRHRLEPGLTPDQSQLHGLAAHPIQPGQHCGHKGLAPVGSGPVLGKAAAAQLAHHRVGQPLAGVLLVGHLPVKVKAEPVLNGGVHGGGGAVPRAGVGLGKAEICRPRAAPSTLIPPPPSCGRPAGCGPAPGLHALDVGLQPLDLPVQPVLSGRRASFSRISWSRAHSGRKRRQNHSFHSRMISLLSCFSGAAQPPARRQMRLVA